jgi:hypothetical protein
LCAGKGLVLPSVDIFLQQHKNPKAYMLFYEYFLKSVVGHTKWMETLSKPFEEATTFGTPSNEALLCCA